MHVASSQPTATANSSDNSSGKVRLMQMLQKKQVVGFDSQVALESVVRTDGQFQFRMRMPNVLPDREWLGAALGTKKAAQNSAIDGFLADAAAMQAFEGWKPSVDGSANSGTISSIVLIFLGLRVIMQVQE